MAEDRPPMTPKPVNDEHKTSIEKCPKESSTRGDSNVKHALYPCISRETTYESPYEWDPRAMCIYNAAHYRASNVSASYVC